MTYGKKIKRVVHGIDLTSADRKAVVDFYGEGLGNDFSFTDTQVFEFIGSRCIGSVEDEEMARVVEIEDYVLETEDREFGLLADGVVFGRVGFGSYMG
jgi:hypothetical protein